MADDFEGGRSRRRYERVTGPFDGRLEEPVLVYDLSLGGCFVNSERESPIGTVSVLQIKLPEGVWVTVNAQTMHSLQHGYGVGFVDLDDESAVHIARTVATYKDRRRL